MAESTMQVKQLRGKWGPPQSHFPVSVCVPCVGEGQSVWVGVRVAEYVFLDEAG